MEGDDAFLNLAPLICRLAQAWPRPGDVVMRINITYSDDRTLDLEIPYGSLEGHPPSAWGKGQPRSPPLKGFDVGAGPGAKRKSIRLVGGMMGLIIDARGRPLQFRPIQRNGSRGYSGGYYRHWSLGVDNNVWSQHKRRLANTPPFGEPRRLPTPGEVLVQDSAIRWNLMDVIARCSRHTENAFDRLWRNRCPSSTEKRISTCRKPWGMRFKRATQSPSERRSRCRRNEGPAVHPSTVQ